MKETNKVPSDVLKESVTDMCQSLTKDIEHLLLRQRYQWTRINTIVLLVVVSFATVSTYTVGKARHYDKLSDQIKVIMQELVTVEMKISETRSDLMSLHKDINQTQQSIEGMERAVTELLKVSLREDGKK